MSFSRAVQIWKITSLVLAGIYVLAALVGFLADFSTGHTVAWLAFLGGGAVAILLGHRLFGVSPVVSAVLVSAGTVAGAFPLFLTILVPIAAAVVVALSFAIGRQASAVST
jgi:hypothetical protein